MKKNESIKKILSTDVLSVQLAQPLSEVSKILAENAIHHVPVLDGKKPVGMISAHDMFKLTFDVDGTDRRMADAVLDHQFKVVNVMSKSIKTLSENATVRDAAEVLQSGDLHSVLVVNDSGELAGIATTTDVVRYLLAQF